MYTQKVMPKKTPGPTPPRSISPTGIRAMLASTTAKEDGGISAAKGPAEMMGPTAILVA